MKAAVYRRICILLCVGGLIGSVSAEAGGPARFVRNVLGAPDGLRLDSRVWWKDIDGDGLKDLIAVGRSGCIHIFRQTAAGFPSNPTESLPMPAGAAWFATMDVSADPHLEIVVSHAGGVGFYRQNRQSGSRFDPQLVSLIKAKQVYSQGTVPFVVSASNSRIQRSRWKNAIPVVFSDHSLMYELTRKGTATAPAEKVELEIKRELKIGGEGFAFDNSWNGPRWSVGGTTPGWLEVDGWAEIKDAPEQQEDRERERLLGELKNVPNVSGRYLQRKDIDGDGGTDAVVWYRVKNPEWKTTCRVYMRREDGTLPEKPDQIIRARGVPADWYPLVDVDGDGCRDIVMMELKNRPLSLLSLVKMVTTNGLEFVFTVRRFVPGRGFSRRPDFRMDVTAYVPVFYRWRARTNLDGDFNGDGRKDLMIRRLPTKIDIYLSTAGGFYQRQPGIELQVPPNTRPWVGRYNADKTHDIAFLDYDNDRIVILLSQEN